MTDTKFSRDVEETVTKVVAVYEAHRQRASWLDRSIAGVTMTFGRSVAVVLLTVAAVAWLIYNYKAEQLGWRALDPAPFVGIEVAATLFALVLSVLILATQQRNDQLAEQRAQLTLQLGAVSLC